MMCKTRSRQLYFASVLQAASSLFWAKCWQRQVRAQTSSESYASHSSVAKYASYSPAKLDCRGLAGGVIPVCYPEPIFKT